MPHDAGEQKCLIWRNRHCPPDVRAVWGADMRVAEPALSVAMAMPFTRVMQPPSSPPDVALIGRVSGSWSLIQTGILVKAEWSDAGGLGSLPAWIPWPEPSHLPAEVDAVAVAMDVDSVPAHVFVRAFHCDVNAAGEPVGSASLSLDHWGTDGLDVEDWKPASALITMPTADLHGVRLTVQAVWMRWPMANDEGRGHAMGLWSFRLR